MSLVPPTHTHTPQIYIAPSPIPSENQTVVSGNYRRSQVIQIKVKEGQALNKVPSVYLANAPEKSYQQAESGAAGLAGQELDSAAVDRNQQQVPARFTGLSLTRLFLSRGRKFILRARTSPPGFPLQAVLNGSFYIVPLLFFCTACVCTERGGEWLNSFFGSVCLQSFSSSYTIYIICRYVHIYICTHTPLPKIYLMFF